jgi:hypothetical protein
MIEENTEVVAAMAEMTESREKRIFLLFCWELVAGCWSGWLAVEGGGVLLLLLLLEYVEEIVLLK